MPEPVKRKAKSKARPKKKPAAKRKARVRKRDKLSVVFSFRNEQDVLDELLNRLHAALDPLGMELEFIFVNDNSTDGSLELLMGRAVTDPAIRIITMSARFGVNPCFLAGMRAATGDAIVTMDTDLQDPPEVIPELVEKWRAGFDVVHTTREQREGESFVKKFITHTAYRLINAASEIDIPVDSGMFKLVSRRALEAVLSNHEVDMYLRGVMRWVGFPQERVFYKREQRFAGAGHFPLTHKDPWLAFVRALFSFSRVPIALLVVCGEVITVAGLVALVVVLLLPLADVEVEFIHIAFCALTALGGANLAALGIVGIYLSRVYNQIKGRPEYIVESTFGFEE